MVAQKWESGTSKNIANLQRCWYSLMTSQFMSYSCVCPKNMNKLTVVFALECHHPAQKSSSLYRTMKRNEKLLNCCIWYSVFASMIRFVLSLQRFLYNLQTCFSLGAVIMQWELSRCRHEKKNFKDKSLVSEIINRCPDPADDVLSLKL